MKFKTSLTIFASTLVLISNAAQSLRAFAQPPMPTTQCGFIDMHFTPENATHDATQPTITPTVTATLAVTPIALPTQAISESNNGELGDEALTTYRDTTLGFSIDYPHSWSQEMTFTSGVCFTGHDASIAVQFGTNTAPTDLMAYVAADEANIQAALPGYKQVYLKPSTEINGAIILGYEWDAGKSSVTEKPIHARTDRYYRIDDAGRLVIVTETEPIDQFDPDGVRDTALTYQIVK